jgi:hypothetical protein
MGKIAEDKPDFVIIRELMCMVERKFPEIIEYLEKNVIYPREEEFASYDEDGVPLSYDPMGYQEAIAIAEIRGLHRLIAEVLCEYGK